MSIALASAPPVDQSGPAPVAKKKLGRPQMLAGGALAAVIAIGAGGAFVHARAQHVFANDARVASHVVAVSSESAGRLVELTVNPGDAVTAGQVMARIEPRDAQFALAEIDAKIAGLAAQQAQLRAQQGAIRNRVAKQVGVSNAGVTEAQAAFGAQEAEVRAARNAFDRTRLLYDKGLVARSRFDEDQARLTAAEQSARRAQAQIAGAQAGVGVTRAAVDDVTVLQQQIAVLEAQKRALQAERSQQTLDLGRREIRAPFNGVVDQTFVDAGEYVTPGARLLMVHGDKDIWIDVNVKETDVRKLQVGAKAKVKVDAYPGQSFPAKVSRIGGAATSQFALLPNPNPSGNFTKVTQRLPVRLALERPDPRLRPGMMVEATIDVVD